MNLATIEMDRNVARRAFLDYRAAVRERHDEEDRAIMTGYRALSRGQQLIRLSDTLRAGGTETKTIRVGRSTETVIVPRLAVARADARVVFTAGVDRTGGCLITADRQDRELARNNQRDRTRIASGTFELGNDSWWHQCMRAIVPNVPPPLRPAHALSGYQILWEAEWAVHPVPPVDPALLKHVGGDLYAVVAVWDLSPLEQAVLAARAG